MLECNIVNLYKNQYDPKIMVSDFNDKIYEVFGGFDDERR